MRIGKAHSAASVEVEPKVWDFKFPDPKPVFSAPMRDWIRALLFMLSMSALGLHFYPALLVLIALLADSFRFNKYHFLLQVLLFCGGVEMVAQDLLLIKRSDLLLLAAIISLFYLKTTMPEIRKALKLYFLFVASTVFFIVISPESILGQLPMARWYLLFIVFVVPILIFDKQQFDTVCFFRVLLVYTLIMCAFYVLDGFIVRGWFFIPASYSPYDVPSTFYNVLAKPFRLTYFPRKYPGGLILLILSIYPLIKFYRFNLWQWLVVILALIASRTMTVIAAFVFCYIVFQGGGKRLIIGAVCGLVFGAGLYSVDKATGGFLRISSTVDQFRSLDTMMEREDLADFGSTRAAQIIPKMELLYENGRQWIGFGFINPETDNELFQVTNDLYSSGATSESATAVEESHFQTVLNVGYLGLIIQTIFYVGLYMIVRRLPLSKYYLSVFVALSISGLGGFYSINWLDGLLPLAWSYSVVFLNCKNLSKRSQKDMLAMSSGYRPIKYRRYERVRSI